YLADSGLDDSADNTEPRLIFKEFIIEPRLRHLLSGWCIDNSSFSSIHVLNNAQDDDQDIDDRNLTHSNCTEIKLGSKWNKHKIESAGFISTNLENNGLLESIMRVYSSYFSWEQALLKTKLCISEAVETTLSADSQSAFGIIKGIIEHTWNDDQVYVFIYLDWLEDLKKCDNLLGCPIYCLQHTCNNFWDRIHLISIVSKSPNVPFVHYCKAGCFSQ
ncbi:12625_t:CDS:2, partial [Funneliformis caledonium]